MEQVLLALPSPAPWDCGGALTMQSLIFFLFPLYRNCAHCQHVQLLLVCSRALQLQQVSLITAGMRSKGALQFGQFPLCGLLLPLFVSFARKAWDRHAKLAFYQVWESWLPFNSLKIAGEPRKAEMHSFKGLVVSKGQSERHRHLKTLCKFQANLHCVQSMLAKFLWLPGEL